MPKIQNWLERRTKIILLIYILVSIVGIAIGFVYFTNQKKALKYKIEDELKSIAVLKASEINVWLAERFADANVIAQSSVFNKTLEQYIKSKEKNSFDYLSQKINVVKKEYGYGEVIIADSNAFPILSTQGELSNLDNKINHVFQEIKITKRTTISGFYKCKNCNEIHLDFISPILGTVGKNKIIGYVILRVNPYNFLYPLIKTWPTESKTAETVLVQRDGDSAVFLSNVRHSELRALELKVSLKQNKIPAARAVNGKLGIFEGQDYRNVKVLSYSTKILHTSWFMISKVDTAEIYKPIRKQSWVMGIILVLTFLLLTLILFTIKNFDQKKYYKTLLDLELKQRILEKRYQNIVRYANDIIIIANKEGFIVEANNSALEAYQLTLDEIKTKEVSDLGKFNASFAETHPNKDTEIVDSSLYESVNIRKNGDIFPVEISEKIIRIDKTQYYQAIIRDISERKKAEEKLKISDEKFRNFFEFSNVGKSITSIDGTISTNKAYRDMLGYTTKELDNIPWQKITHPDDIENDNRIIKLLLSREISSARWEKRYIHKNGKVIWTDISTVLQFDDNNRPLYFITSVVDISKYKTAEQTIRDTQKWFKTTLYSIADGIITADTEGKILQMNKVASKLTSWKEEDAIGKNIDEIFVLKNGKSNTIKESPAIKALKEGEATVDQSNESILISKKGKEIPIAESAAPILDENNKIIGIVLIFRSQVEEREAQKKLIESKENFQAVTENANDAIVVTLNGGRHVFANRRATEITGYTFEEMEKIGLKGYAHPDELPKLLDRIKRRLAGENVPPQYETALVNKQRKNIQVEITASKSTWKGEPADIVIIRDITERKEIEHRLKESEERFRGIYENASMGIYRSTPDGRILLCNPALLKMLGYKTFEELSKRNLEQEGFELDANRKNFREVIDKNGEIIGYEAGWKRKDGSIIHVLENAKAYKDSKGNIVYYEGSVQDISKTKKAIEQLKQSEDRFRTLVESAPEAVFIQSGGNFVYLNPAALKLFKVTNPNQLIGQPVINFLYSNYKESFQQKISELNKKEISSIEITCLNIDNGFFEVEVSAVPFTYNSTSSALVFLHDITERKKAETEIRMLNEELEQKVINRTMKLNETLNFVEHIMSNTNVGFAVYNNNGNCILANNAIAEIVGGTKDLLLQQNYNTIQSWKENKLYENAKQAFKEQKTKRAEVLLNSSFGKSAWLDCRFTPFKLNNIDNLLLTVNDITERISKEQEIKDLNEELKTNIEQLRFLNNELEAFSYSVSHDLRAPLRAIHGFIQILFEDYSEKLDGEGKRLMNIVQDNTIKMGQLIDDLLAFSRISRSELNKTEIDSNAIVNMAFQSYPIDEQKQKVKLTVANLPNITGDTILMQQVWVNLISNAIKYSSKVENPEIEIGYKENKDAYEFYIKDNGAGFDMQYVDKLFGVFQRLHSNREFIGTGVGLAIVQRIVSKHGGTVSAYGEVNNGATFRFTIPK